MSSRVIVSEILDGLPAEDPEAVRSRRDLARINGLMGNERWILKTAGRFPEVVKKGVVEIGAGDGRLCGKLARAFPGVSITGFDLAPRPDGLPVGVKWVEGDVFRAPRPEAGGMVVANLFLHHFDKEALGALGRWLEGFDVWVINEPDRARIPHLLGWMMHPWVNRVTRHDLHVSIRAGFGHGEIGRDLGWEMRGWQVEETSTWRGARRVLGWRV